MDVSLSFSRFVQPLVYKEALPRYSQCELIVIDSTLS